MRPGIAIAFACSIVAAAAIGWFGRGATGGGDAAGSGVCPDGAAPLYWKAPMDPTYVREGPGKSPMGMDLVPECPAAGGTSAEGGIRVDSATVQTIGVRTARVETRDIARSIRAVGRVTYDERLVTHAHSKVQGWVEQLSVEYVGQAVERGQPLLEIYSPELVATQEELLLAARYRDATDESPFEDVRGGGRSLFEATRRRLALWDVPERDIERLLRTGKIRKTLTLYAPSPGVVTYLGVRRGMEVRPNENLYTVADLSRVWVVADVYEFELPWIELGQEGAVELSYLPGERFSGEVTYIAPFLDPATRTAQVRIELENRDGRLKPEMFGDIVLAGTPRPDALVIPSEAVIRTGERTIAVVALGEGRFEPRNVTLGLDSGDGWLEVRDGLAEGEDVVVSSQFLIDSESRLEEAVNKLLRTARPEAEAQAEPEPAHEGHPMPSETPEHEGHPMPSEPPEHEGHAMPPPADEHSHHEMGH